MDRRQFLATAAVGGAAALGGGYALADSPGPLPSGNSSWADIKRQFDIAPNIVQMSSFYLASHPTPVREAIERHRRGLDRDSHSYIEQNIGPLERAVRDQAAAYLGVNADELALTDSTTMGLGTLYGGIRLGQGHEALCTEHDHYSTRESLRLRAARTGAAVREISLYADLKAVSQDEIVETLVRKIRPNTRVVAVTWVHSGTGLKLPIRRMAHALGVLNAKRDASDRVIFCVDGVHAFGAEDVDLPELGCDFFIAGTHKWIFGPRGTGLVWGRQEAWASATPTIPTFTGDETHGSRMTPGGFHSFEHRWALREAFDFQQRIGRDRAAARVRELATRLKDGLVAIRGVRLQTPRDPELSGGIVCFEIDGIDSEEVVARLWERRVVASRSPYVSHFVRFSPTIVNSDADIERAVREVHRIAASASRS